MLKALVVLMLLPGLTGCATVITKREGRWGDKFSGTKCGAARTKEVWPKTKFGALMSSLDTGVSAIADTVLYIFADAWIKPKKDYPKPCPE
jgi:uncharacterized protein YceK